MAFTLDQDVSGAAASPQPVQQVQNTSIAAGVIGGLLDVGASFARGMPTPTTATQSDRDRAAIRAKLREAQQAQSDGMSKDDLVQNFAIELATLGMNAEEKSLAVQILGADAFAVTQKTPSVVDIKIEQFNQAGSTMQQGFIKTEIDKAAAKGEEISDQVAAQRAVETYSAFQVAANAGMMQGNLDWASGFDQNIRTLDSFTSAVSKALQVEQGGQNFSLENLQRLRDGFLVLKSQPSFQKPTGTGNLEKWEIMNSRLTSVDSLFTALQGYDAANATEAATRMMATLALDKGGTVLAALSLKDPALTAQIASAATLDLKTAIADGYEVKEVDYKTLNFDPAVLELMGITPSGQPVKDAPPIKTLPPGDSFFSPDVSEKFDSSDDWTNGKNMMFHKGTIETLPIADLKNPETANAFATSVMSLSYGLTKNTQPSTGYINALFSNASINKLNALEAQGGEGAVTAANLRTAMGLALQHQQTVYGGLAAGLTQTIPGIGVDSTTGKYILTGNQPTIQALQAVAAKYYGKDFEAMWKEGGSARTLLKSRLARSGDIEPDSAAYDQFLAATEVLDNPLWKGMAGQYAKVSGIPERLKFFKDMAKRIKVDIGSNAVEDLNPSAATPTVLEPTPEVSRPPQGSVSNPWAVANEEAYTMVPVGAHYRVGTNPTVRIKKGQ
tara:strand:- start:135 stop:2150 length:2016 start_codon:yes stop_codon:yes gene_type:complete